jgi:hypothetical protein
MRRSGGEVCIQRGEVSRSGGGVEEKWRRSEGEVEEGGRKFKFWTLILWFMGTRCATVFFFFFLYFAAKNL